jgi:ABC-type branched-subunit amino acid transport system ATPase component
LSATGIVKRFGGVTAVDSADLTVEQGTITGLIGPNGAGKTTLFNILSGTLAADEGRVVFDGHDITGLPPERIAASGLTRTFQIARGFPSLTVLESLMLYAPGQAGDRLPTALFSPGRWRRQEREIAEKAWQVATMLKLDGVIDNRTGALSGGQKKLLEIGRALMAEPTLILLDEPVAGVNPTLSREIADVLTDLRSRGYTFLVVEHDMDTVARLCDPVTVMAAGRPIARGSFAEVVADREVQDAYLGAVPAGAEAAVS